MKILMTICARGGSKGIPKKNIKPIANKPLIAYSIASAQKFANFFDCDIALSTDDVEIKNCATEYGLVDNNYVRPQQFATDSAGKLDAIIDILTFYETKNKVQYDYLIDLDVTSPLRTLEDLLTAFKLLQENKTAMNIFSVNPAHRNPYFNMVEQGEDGYFHLIKKLPSAILTRQSAPKVYDMNASFYIYKKLFFTQKYRTAITDKSLIYVMPHICFDLDEVSDYEYLSFLIDNNKLSFEL